MFLLSKPSTAVIEEFLGTRASDRYSYPEVGATRAAAPKGYNVDHNRILLGRGDAAFQQAKDAICAWKMFDVPGLTLIHPDTPIESGRNVALLAHHLGFYSLSSCRIVYVIDEADRFGFAYGTLTEHVEIGEERFSIEFDRESNEVWYDIFAFSRPGNILVRLGYPYSRYLQKQFAVGSKAAMIGAVQRKSEPGAVATG